MTKRSIQQEEITIVNIYASNIGSPKYVKQILTDIKEETDSNTVTAWNLTHHLHQWTDRKSIKKKNWP